MAVSKSVILLFAALALAAAQSEDKAKRQIYGAYPYSSHLVAPAATYAAAPVAYAAPAAHYAAAPVAYAAAPAVAYAARAYDDGKYYPGKYERPTVYSNVYSGGYY